VYFTPLPAAGAETEADNQNNLFPESMLSDTMNRLSSEPMELDEPSEEIFAVGLTPTKKNDAHDPR
jgi:hypothetical protein